MTRKEARERIADYLKANPHMTYREVSAKLNCGLSTIGKIAREFGITRYNKYDLSKLEN